MGRRLPARKTEGGALVKAWISLRLIQPRDYHAELAPQAVLL
jgi:hypothetical protein